MKFRFLLLILILSSFILRAQEPYTKLIFSEVRMDQGHHAYAELCNMGDVAVDLGEFEFGNITPWNDPYVSNDNNHLRLPSHMLNPGDTYVIAIVREWANEQALLDPEEAESTTKDDMWRLADLQLHASESPGGTDPTDSITPGYGALDIWGGTYCYYLRHHYIEGDSVVIDAVNGIFTGDDGRRPGDEGPSQVAGVPDATVNSILVRKFNIKNGNLDWEQARGVDIGDSEWIPIPTLSDGGYEAGRKAFWTVGNHGDFKLNAESLVSSTIDIDWDTKTMNCQWGARNEDSLMNEFVFAPGIAWHYHMARNKIDSAYTSVRTGDSITLYACGVTLEYAKFGIIALAPSASEARVIPMNAKSDNGGWYPSFVVSEDIPGMDTISEIGFDSRVDTLYKYLEKPANASWEVIWVDGIERPDLKDGDILKVTSEDAANTKEYYIKVEKYVPSHDANLSAITWPDIPDFYKGIYGWLGDTIPNFSPTKYNYNVQVPWDTEGIPSLIAMPANQDTKIEVKRATSLFGSEDAKTVKFYTTAEDDTTFQTYNVRLEKEKDLSNVQPYSPDPFISQLVFRTDWRQFFLEICNPGNQSIDLSDYCIVRSTALTPAEAITTASTDADWASRFNRYIPGYVWQDEATWGEQPGYLVEDLGVNPILEPGDVFVIAWAFNDYKDMPGEPWPNFDQIDVNFKNGYNPWGIELGEEASGLSSTSTVCGGWYNNDWILYKIINDSIRDGLKPLIDPYDVEVVDVIGNCDNTVFGDINGVTFDQNSGLKRLPEYYKGNVEPGGSFGDGVTGSEWFYSNQAYWDADYGWPVRMYMSSDGIGSHEFNTITEFISTVASASYSVSEGYSDNETIGGGVQEGITVAEFLQSIIYLEDQVLTLTSGGVELIETDLLPDGAVLTVVSPNGDNTTVYTINVTAEGLDNNAMLTSSVYTIEVDGATGTISGIELGATLREVFESVTPPSNASLFGAFKADGSYAPFVQMKFDTTYVEVLASNQIFFEVIAQDGETKIEYQLMLNSLASDAYVISNVYDIDQDAAMIKLIPDGTNVSSLFNNLTSAPGATFALENKLGQARTMGTIYEDDQLIVTAEDGVTQKVYTLELYSDYAARYEAQVSSDIYTVNQQTKKISDVLSGVTVDEFLDNISVSLGASFVFLDADDNPKTEGAMDDNDQVVVTSENGLVINIYKVIIDRTDVITLDGSLIKMYPNPTSGFINVSGVKEGNTIRIFNSVGQNIESFVADSDRATISISDQPTGIYMISVNDGSLRVANIRFIKK